MADDMLENYIFVKLTCIIMAVYVLLVYVMLSTSINSSVLLFTIYIPLLFYFMALPYIAAAQILISIALYIKKNILFKNFATSGVILIVLYGIIRLIIFEKYGLSLSA